MQYLENCNSYAVQRLLRGSRRERGNGEELPRQKHALVTVSCLLSFSCFKCSKLLVIPQLLFSSSSINKDLHQ